MGVTTTRVQGFYMRFFVHENRKHHSILLYEWLLEQAKKIGAPRGTAFRAIADFGRSKVIHQQQFFELAGEITIRVDFLVTADERDKLLELVESEDLKIPYALFPVEFGITDGNH